MSDSPSASDQDPEPDLDDTVAAPNPRRRAAEIEAALVEDAASPPSVLVQAEGDLDDTVAGGAPATDLDDTVAAPGARLPPPADLDDTVVTAQDALALPAAPAPGADADPVDTDTPPEGSLEIRRGALWEDVIHGSGLASLMGLLLFPSLGVMMAAGGQASVMGQARGMVVSAMFLAAAWLARLRVGSLVLFDPAERAIHDAVRLGSTIYVQGSFPFDQAEHLELIRREARKVRKDNACGAPEEVPLEGRGELVLGSGRRIPISNWVEEDRTLPSPWSRLLGKLDGAAEMLGLPLEESAQVAPPDWDTRRYLVWVASIGVTAGALVVLGA